MIRFYLQKLVRDKIVDKCLSDPEVLHSSYRTLDDEAFRFELRRKLHEEATAVLADYDIDVELVALGYRSNPTP